ncbi:hypothetical protein JXO52_01810 [bacterium]|nr:hypothetical protein [bacterium]
MTPLRPAVCLFVFQVLFFACSNSPTHTFSIETDGGTVIATSGTGPKYETPFYEFKETLSLGDEANVPVLFQPQELVVGEDGTLYITDENRIKKFAADGAFRQYIGREGQGPGEVYYPGLCHIFGDTIYAKQKWGSAEFLEAYHLFKTVGTYIESKTFRTPPAPLLDNGSSHIVLILNGRTALYSSVTHEQKGNVTIRRFAFGLTDEHRNPLSRLDLPIIQTEPSYTTVLERGPVGVGRPYVLHSPRFTEKNGTLYCLHPAGKEIYIITPAGKTEKMIVLDLPDLPVTAQERDTLTSQNWFKRMAANVGAGFIPDRKPLCCEIVVSDDGFIWLKHGRDMMTNGKAAFTYRLLSPEGEYLCDQPLPIDLKAVDRENAYGFERTTDGLAVFKRLKLIHR